jgi:lipopolysaccharide transport system ATP-binding protein
MSKTVIKVENLSKLYRLGQVGTGTVSHDLNRWFAKIRGKEDPFAIVGQVNDRTKKAEGDYAWALKDINFEVKQGEVLGIIGKNGAGKSTLLKLLSQITSPTTGEIKVKGRIAALLEVGTGMHPEMSARENIYLNGAILGMRKQEIKAKFDEIVDFSGCAMYVDTPIKRYSSGMRVRLGFAVAAFLEPEILIVDEVLAVGDAEFQKKAIGKMKQVSENDGRTVLFVSHNMQAVKRLCNKAIVIENGFISYDGEIENGINHYLTTSKDVEIGRLASNLENDSVKVNEIKIFTQDGNKNLFTGSEIQIEVNFNLLIEDEAIFHCTMHFYDELNNCIFYLSSGDSGIDEKTGRGNYKMTYTIPPFILHEGDYKIGTFLIVRNRAEQIIRKTDVLFFRVNQTIIQQFGWSGRVGVIRPIFKTTKTYYKNT